MIWTAGPEIEISARRGLLIGRESSVLDQLSQEVGVAFPQQLLEIPQLHVDFSDTADRARKNRGRDKTGPLLELDRRLLHLRRKLFLTPLLLALFHPLQYASKRVE